MARNDKLRIVQWYTGDIACHQIRVLERCPSMELVGAFVFHEDKVGLDAGEIAGIGPIGVRATNDLDAMLAVDADCVLYNPPYERYDEIVPILASGKNVVSIMSGWNPKKLDCYPDIVAACERGRSSRHAPDSSCVRPLVGARTHNAQAPWDPHRFPVERAGCR